MTRADERTLRQRRRDWRQMRRTIERNRHAIHCACIRCDPLYQMTREGDTP